ncbi:MAG TPA: response regulator [Dehalococcoidia bacterium]|nr:response regulator [Dehalococcoidia bacterium]
MAGHLLVVDDDPDIRGVLVLILAGEGWRVITARDGQEALGAIAADPPRLVLLDLSMPIVDGWAVLATLRERCIDVPVIVLTAGTGADAAALTPPAVAALQKPFDVDDLLAAVSRALAASG